MYFHFLLPSSNSYSFPTTVRLLDNDYKTSVHYISLHTSFLSMLSLTMYILEGINNNSNTHMYWRAYNNTTHMYWRALIEHHSLVLGGINITPLTCTGGHIIIPLTCTGGH